MKAVLCISCAQKLNLALKQALRAFAVTPNTVAVHAARSTVLAGTGGTAEARKKFQGPNTKDVSAR